MGNEFTFTRPLTYELKTGGDIEISLDISTTEADLVNDIVSKNFLKSMQSQIIERNLKLDLEHEAFRGDTIEEKEINKTRVPAGRMVEPVIKEYKNENNEYHYALNIKGLMNKNRSDYKEIKGNIVEKFLDAGSIAFIPTKYKKETKGAEVFRILDDGILLNVALTGNPVNTGAQIKNIVAKSIATLEEYKTEKKLNPEVEMNLEVKAQRDRRASERRKLRNEGMEDDEDDEDENENKKMKSYNKDGAHAHTDNGPLGDHNHPEIEERITTLQDMMVDTISTKGGPGSGPRRGSGGKIAAAYAEGFRQPSDAAKRRAAPLFEKRRKLWAQISKLPDNMNPVQQRIGNKLHNEARKIGLQINRILQGKSHSNEINTITEKEETKMSDKITKDEEAMESTEESNDSETESESTEEPTEVTAEEFIEEPAAEESSEPLSEVKSMLRKLSGDIKSLRQDINILKDDGDEPTEPERKAISKAILSNENTQNLSEVKSFAGLGELR